MDLENQNLAAFSELSLFYSIISTAVASTTAKSHQSLGHGMTSRESSKGLKNLKQLLPGSNGNWQSMTVGIFNQPH